MLRELTRRTALIGLVALLLSLSVAYGEEPPPLGLGARVRVLLNEPSQSASATHGKTLKGRLLGISDTAITLETSPSRAPVILSRQNVAGLELSLRRSQRKKGALIGLGVGAAAGLVLVAADSGGSCPPPEEDLFGLCRGFQEDFSGPEYYALSAALLGAAGAGIGALVAPGEKWKTVTSDRLRLAVEPARGGGVRFGVSLAF